MARHGGFQGGMMPGNMNNLMKQAQKLQRQMEEQAKEFESMEFEASAGGTVVVSGKKEITKVSLDKDVVDPDDVEMLEDLIMAACNEALRKMEEYNKNNMSKLTGGLGGLPF